MLTIRYQKAFKRDYKQLKKRGHDVRLLERTIELLAEGKGLPPEYTSLKFIRLVESRELRRSMSRRVNC